MITKYLQVLSLGEPKLQTTCLSDYATHPRFLEQNPFSGRLKFLLTMNEISFFPVNDTLTHVHRRTNENAEQIQCFMENTNESS